MKPRLPLTLMILLFILLTSFSLIHEKNNFLFKIERSKDANQIFYTLNTNEDGLLKEKPITAFWIKKTKKGKIEPLTWIQKKYAYGLKYLHTCDKCATFQFVSYDKINLLLRKYKDEYKVFTQIKDDVLEVERIFIQIDGGTFWVPNVTAVQLHSHNFVTGEKVIKTIQP